ncbi:MAG TPA: T9SS type A sorting domain-containing protein [Bacteroidia bacterium]|nr:T9SS type A sorting domain-containing protein [Bacteroidia bacterium]
MTRQLFFLSSIIFLASGINGQVTQQWVENYNGTVSGNDRAVAMKVDAVGNTYVTGYSQNGSSGNDYTTVKYNSSGVQQWVATYNGTGNNNDYATAIAIDGSGNTYVTGYSMNTGYTNDYVTIKYNSSGVQQWAAVYTGVSNYAQAIAVDAAGNSYVTGYAHDGSSFNYATVKYNSSGVQQWVAIYNGTGNGPDMATAIVVDGAGNTYVTGNAFNGSDYDYATVKYNSAGTQQWVAIHNGAGNNADYAKAIAADASGNIYVTGNCYNGSNHDYVTIEYNSSGAQQWIGIYNGPANSTDQANAIAVDGSGNTYVTGFSFNGSNYDFATVSYNSSGAQQWAAVYAGGGNADDRANVIALDAGGNVYVTGMRNGGDYATIKYDNGGAQQWIISYTGTAGSYDEAFSIGLDAMGNVYVTGYATNTANGNDYATIKYSQPPPLSFTQSETDLSCNGICNGEASVVATGGTAPYTYAWSSGGTAATESGLCAGNYTCTITDASSVTVTATFDITEPSALTSTSSATSVLCNGGTSTVTVAASGGTSPYSGDGTFSETAGTYSYTVTDFNGCTNTSSVTITEPSALTSTSSATSVLCNGGTSTVTVAASGGTSPYSGDGTFSETAGTYSYTVTDFNGCTNTSSVTITEPSALTSTSSATSVLCNGGTSTVTVAASGGTSPYSGDGTFSETAGTYSYTVTDFNGCTSTSSVTITEPAQLFVAVTATTDPATCAGSDGAIDITVSGGTPVYTYQWSNSSTNEDPSGLTAGTYSCTITDADGCTAAGNATLTDPNPPAVTVTFSQDTVCQADGAYALSGGLPAGGAFSGPGVTSGFFDPGAVSLGMNPISYTYTDMTTGCSSTAADSIDVELCTGMDAPHREISFTLLPNPNNGIFLVEIDGEQAVDVVICDALGQLISAQKVEPHVGQQFSLANPGVYFVAVIMPDGRRSCQRVMVNR